MYPVVRLGWQLWKHRNDAPLSATGTHVSRHVCWPWDIDFWLELNNGRTLTIYDLGRLPLSGRMGLTRALMANRWGMSIVGASVRYRRRVRAFDLLEMRSRGLCWDDRFFYSEQSMWKTNGDCASHALFRSAVTGGSGIVPPAQVLQAMGQDPVSPPMPDWVAAWTRADAERPWPPMANA